jgi:hypothetical protein
MSEDYPVLITMNVGASDDEWLRVMIRSEKRGTALTRLPTVQRVVCQDSREAERIVSALAVLKYQRKQPYGGSVRERWIK